MEILKKLTPAETLFIVQRGIIGQKEYLRYTFMDLVLKKVLSITWVTRQFSSREPVRRYMYIEAGENYFSYTPLKHEAPLLDIFKKEDKMRILLRNYVSICAKSTYRTYKSLLLTENIAHYINQSWFDKWFTHDYTIKPETIKASIEIDLFLNTLDDKMEKYRLHELIALIGGNVLLLKNFSPDLLDEINAELKIIDKKTHDAWGWSDGCGGSTFGADSFDKEFDSGADSGCSGWGCGGDGGGDSGCSSGCSGCGGGCGGD